MKYLLISIFLTITFSLLPTAVSGHWCGQACDEFTKEGACTHGCKPPEMGGELDPQYHGGRAEYRESSQRYQAAETAKVSEDNRKLEEDLARATAAAADAAARAAAAATQRAHQETQAKLQQLEAIRQAEIAVQQQADRQQKADRLEFERRQAETCGRAGACMTNTNCSESQYCLGAEPGAGVCGQCASYGTEGNIDRTTSQKAALFIQAGGNPQQLIDYPETILGKEDRQALENAKNKGGEAYQQVSAEIIGGLTQTAVAAGARDKNKGAQEDAKRRAELYATGSEQDILRECEVRGGTPNSLQEARDCIISDFSDDSKQIVNQNLRNYQAYQSQVFNVVAQCQKLAPKNPACANPQTAVDVIAQKEAELVNQYANYRTPVSPPPDCPRCTPEHVEGRDLSKIMSQLSSPVNQSLAVITRAVNLRDLADLSPSQKQAAEQLLTEQARQAQVLDRYARTSDINPDSREIALARDLAPPPDIRKPPADSTPEQTALAILADNLYSSNFAKADEYATQYQQSLANKREQENLIEQQQITQAALELATSPTNISPDERQENRDAILKNLSDNQKEAAKSQATEIRTAVDQYLACRGSDCGQKLQAVGGYGFAPDYLSQLSHQRDLAIANQTLQNTYSQTPISPDVRDLIIDKQVTALSPQQKQIYDTALRSQAADINRQTVQAQVQAKPTVSTQQVSDVTVTTTYQCQGDTLTITTTYAGEYGTTSSKSQTCPFGCSAGACSTLSNNFNANPAHQARYDIAVATEIDLGKTTDEAYRTVGASDYKPIAAANFQVTTELFDQVIQSKGERRAREELAKAAALAAASPQTNLDPSEWLAYGRIQETAGNLGALTPQVQADILAGKIKPTDIENLIAEQTQSPLGQLAVGLNNWTQGSYKRNLEIQLEAEQKILAGDRSLRNYFDVGRGAVAAGAPAAAAAVAIVAAPLAIPVLVAVPAASLLPVALQMTSSAFGIYASTQSWGQTAEVCDLRFQTRAEAVQCSIAAGNAVYMTLSTGLGVINGAAPVAEAVAANKLAAVGANAATVADDAAAALSAITKAKNITPPGWIQWADVGNSILATGVFGTQAVINCGQVVAGSENADAPSCFVHAGMAIASAGRLASLGMFATGGEQLGAATGKLAGSIGEGADVLDGLSSCRFGFGQCVQGLIDAFAGPKGIGQNPLDRLAITDSATTKYQTALSAYQSDPSAQNATDLRAAVLAAAAQQAQVNQALGYQIDSPTTAAEQEFVAARQNYPSTADSIALLNAKMRLDTERFFTSTDPRAGLQKLGRPDPAIAALQAAQTNFANIARSSSPADPAYQTAFLQVQMALETANLAYHPQLRDQILTSRQGRIDQLQSQLTNLETEAEAYAQAAEQLTNKDELAQFEAKIEQLNAKITSLAAITNSLSSVTRAAPQPPTQTQDYLTDPQNSEYLLGQFRTMLETRNQTDPQNPTDVESVVQALRHDLATQGNTTETWEKHISPYTTLPNFIALTQGGVPVPPAPKPEGKSSFQPDGLPAVSVQFLAEWKAIVNSSEAVRISSVDQIPERKRSGIVLPKITPSELPVLAAETATYLLIGETDVNVAREDVRLFLGALEKGEDMSLWVNQANSAKAVHTQKHDDWRKQALERERLELVEAGLDQQTTENVEDLVLVRALPPEDVPVVREDGTVELQHAYQGSGFSKDFFRTTKHFSVNHPVQAVAAMGGGFSWEDTRAVLITPMQEFTAINGAPYAFMPEDVWWAPGLRQGVVLPKGTVVIVQKSDPLVEQYSQLPGFLVVEVEDKPFFSVEAVIRKLGYEVKYPSAFQNPVRLANETGAFYGFHLGGLSGSPAEQYIQAEGDITNDFDTLVADDVRKFNSGEGDLEERIRTIRFLVGADYFGGQGVAGLNMSSGALESWSVKDEVDRQIRKLAENRDVQLPLWSDNYLLGRLDRIKNNFYRIPPPLIESFLKFNGEYLGLTESQLDLLDRPMLAAEKPTPLYSGFDPVRAVISLAAKINPSFSRAAENILSGHWRQIASDIGTSITRFADLIVLESWKAKLPFLVGPSKEVTPAIFIDTVKESLSAEGKLNPVTEGVLDDLADMTGGSGEITDSNIGDVLFNLRRQIEAGINFDQGGMKVQNSLSEALGPKLAKGIGTEVVFRSEPIPKDQRVFGYLGLVEGGKEYDVDGYDRVLELYRLLYGDKADVRLVRYEEEMLVVSSQDVGGRLRITQVLNPGFKETPEYTDFRLRRVRDELTPDEELFGYRGYSADSQRQGKEAYIVVRNLIIEDRVSGKTFDVRTLLPDDWELRYKPVGDTSGFSQEFSQKFLSYSEISSPERLVALFHEHGHSIFTANDDPALFHEADELWKDSRWMTGGPKSLPSDVFNRTKELLIRNERGASARAFEILRILKEQGIDIGMSVRELTDFTNVALTSYEMTYPGGASRFVRPSVFERMRNAIDNVLNMRPSADETTDLPFRFSPFLPAETVVSGEKALLEAKMPKTGQAGGGRNRGRASAFLVGMGAGISLVGAAVDLSDCSVSNFEKGSLNLLSKIGFSTAVKKYAENFSQRCVRWPLEIAPPPVAGISEELQKPYSESQHYFCDGRNPNNPVYEILPSNNLILVGQCGADRSCTNNKCLLQPIEESGLGILDSLLLINILVGGGSFNEAQVYNDDMNYLKRNYGVRFITADQSLTRPSELSRPLKKVCTSLPDDWCRNIVFVYLPKGYPLTNSSFWDMASLNKLILINSSYNPEERTLERDYVHELAHIRQGLYGFDTNTPARYFGFYVPGRKYKDLFPIDTDNSFLKGLLDKPIDEALPYTMLAEYMAITGWYFDLEKRQWKPTGPGWAQTPQGVVMTQQGGVPRDLDEEDYYSRENYKYTNPNEHFAEMVVRYYLDSLGFSGPEPELHNFLKTHFFDGREYKDGEWINKGS